MEDKAYSCYRLNQSDVWYKKINITVQRRGNLHISFKLFLNWYLSFRRIEIPRNFSEFYLLKTSAYIEVAEFLRNFKELWFFFVKQNFSFLKCCSAKFLQKFREIWYCGNLYNVYGTGGTLVYINLIPNKEIKKYSNKIA